MVRRARIWTAEERARQEMAAGIDPWACEECGEPEGGPHKTTCSQHRRVGGPGAGRREALHERIETCPGCSTRNRILSPKAKAIYKCSTCGARFRLGRRPSSPPLLLKPKEIEPQRAPLLKRVYWFASVFVFAELPLLLICAALYHKRTFSHPWVHWVMLGLMIPMWVVIGLTVLVGGSYLLGCFLYWIVTGIDPLGRDEVGAEPARVVRCSGCETNTRCGGGPRATYKCGSCGKPFRSPASGGKPN